MDVNLGQGPSFGAARTLLSRGVPVIFVTGYDGDVIPDDLAHFPRVQKPASNSKIVEVVGWTCGR